MLKRGFEILAFSLILMVLISGIGFAQEQSEATPTPEAISGATPTPTPEAAVIPGPSVSPDDDDSGEEDEGGEDEIKGEKVKVCHIPGGDKDKANTIEISKDALKSHLDHGDYEGECEEEFGEDVDGELGGAGITPDSAFYFLDRWFDGFGNCIDNRKEKVAEIKEMINAGNIEAAAEIAFKIKDLCEQLSKLDPNEYSRVCRVKGDAPKWQIELDDDLTEEQKDGARKFAEVMSQCFKTQGVDCECSELENINKPFADRCSIVAPLASKCEKGDESACEAMDEATQGIEDLLPDYLQDVFDELGEGVEKDKFEFHMPMECREAGAKTPKDCMKVMFEANAPEECQQALKDGKISFDNERGA